MLRRLALSLGLALPLAAWPAAQSPAPAPKTMPSATRWIPDEALVSVELTRPAALLELLLDPEVEDFVTALPPWRDWTSTDDFRELRNVVTYLEGALDTDWRTGVARLIGGGVTFAVGLEERTVLIVEAEDADLLRRLHDIFRDIARAEAAKEGQPDRVQSRRHGDVEVWTFNGKEGHAVVGNRFLLASDMGALTAALDLLAGTRDDSLATSPVYGKAMQGIDPATVAKLFVDFGRLKEAPDVARSLAADRTNPMLSLLFAGVMEALRDSTWLSSALSIEGRALTLDTRGDGAPTDPNGAAAFALPPPGTGPLPNLVVPDRLAALTLHRDLHHFYAAKDTLFPERTSELIFFENMMGIFFSGRDLTDEVFAATRPDVRVVVAEQRYDPAIGTPEVKVPSFAAVIGLHDGEAFGEVLEEAWQKGLGLINFTRGQEALPGLIIDREVRGETEYTVAYFSTAGVEDRTKLHERHNYRPTLAMPGNYVVLSSTESLARDLIDVLEREAAETRSAREGLNSLLELDGPRLARALEANRESLVRSNMIDEGNTREQAETEIGFLLTLVELVRSLEVALGVEDGASHARLELLLNVPTANATSPRRASGAGGR